MVRPRADPRRFAPALAAAALALAFLVWEPPSLDLAAADYRAWLFGHAGFAAWDLRWYGGHHLPGYSVLAPPLGWWLGTRLLGALAAVAAAVLFERLVHARYGARAWLGALWFGAGTATVLLSGRITFALGLVPALAALLALQRSRAARAGGRSDDAGRTHGAARTEAAGATWRRARALVGLALVLALLTALASPVAALFLALAGTAVALAEGGARSPSPTATATANRAAGLGVAAAALAPVAALALAFPEGGVEPFAFSSFWPVLAFGAFALAAWPRGERTLRVAVVLYLLGCSAAYLISTPVGGNAVRLGALCAGPVAALVLWRRRTLALVLVAPLLLWWQWHAGIDDVRTASGDPSVGAAYYAPLLTFLDRASVGTDASGAAAGRVEIPFTRLHWEARYVAPRYALARGWERQLDVKDDALFYTGELTPTRYGAWLDRMAVRWVALPDVRLDYSAQAEARLIERGLPYLREVWHDRHWHVYAVRDPTPLVDPPGRVTALGTDTLALAVARPATLLLRVRWTPYWAVASGDACVSPAGDWTRLRVRRAGRVRLVVRFSLARIGAHNARCAGA